ncbi:unnamed protein product [Candidula unifasciata]|uniref:Uncharacterized protein n=1 Tax=Candidula unifasciata TaxID=100452 RepID=A0A8S3YF70_9EUPU|nr:unnamed protein product [Candidula unifasciata]
MKVDTASSSSSALNSTTNKTLADSFVAVKNMLTGRLKSRFSVPPRYYRQPPSVQLTYTPFQIILVDEIFQSITVSSTITLTWIDYNVGWDPKQFHGIQKIDMPTNLFWTPTVLIPKATQRSGVQLKMPPSLETSYEGYVKAFIPGFTYTLCNLNMAKFPFDTHNCTIVFVDRDQYNITADTMSIEKRNDLGTNVAWILLDYGCSSTKVHIRRRSEFYVANLLTPIVLSSVMTLMVFWIPAETEEKISFLVSMFTSASVFLNYMIDMIPRSVEVLPQLNILVFAIQVQIILATAATAFVLRRYKKEQQIEKQRKILELLGQRERHKTLPTQNNERIDPRTQGSCQSWRRNIVHPEPTGTSNVPQLSDPRAKTTRQLNNVFISDIADPLVYVNRNRDKFSANEVHKVVRENSKQSRSQILTYKQLDTLFFIIVLALTLAVYLLVFLRS